MSNYLFAYFTGEDKQGEQVYFSISKDGYQFTDLNDSKPILISSVGEKGIRDPFIIRDEKKDIFYLIGTDLRIEKGLGWGAALENGSTNIVVSESKDLLCWSTPRLEAIHIKNTNNVWAPEVIYDPDKESFLIFWSSRTDNKHKIYASYTTDFRSFSDPFIFLEGASDVIDATIVFDGHQYIRFFKDEASGRIIMDHSKKLLGVYKQIHSDMLNSLVGVEGPQVYKLPEDNLWCLIVDQFKTDGGYLPLVTDDLSSGIFEISTKVDFGNLKKRHGSITPISTEEYDRLHSFYFIKKPVIKGLYADPDLVKFEDTYYIYPTTDGYMNWGSSEFSVFSSKSLASFEEKTSILNLNTCQVKWAVGSAWAPCMTRKGNMYYYFFCGKRSDDQSCIGVAYSSTPTGPFTAVEQPLLTPEMIEKEKMLVDQVIDPSIYWENERCFLLFGNGNGVICELSEDMMSIKKNSFHQYQGLHNFTEAIEVFKRDNLYHFTWSSGDTRDENYHVNYGTSESLYGPINYQFPLLEKNSEKNILGTGHHSIFKEPELDCYYIAYHRFAFPNDATFEKRGYNREICLSPLSFDEKGLLKKVEI